MNKEDGTHVSLMVFSFLLYRTFSLQTAPTRLIGGHREVLCGNTGANDITDDITDDITVCLCDD